MYMYMLMYMHVHRSYCTCTEDAGVSVVGTVLERAPVVALGECLLVAMAKNLTPVYGDSVIADWSQLRTTGG